MKGKTIVFEDFPTSKIQIRVEKACANAIGDGEKWSVDIFGGVVIGK